MCEIALMSRYKRTDPERRKTDVVDPIRTCGVQDFRALSHFGTFLKLQDVFDYAVGERAFPGDI
jgi:hypothetical protein